MYGIFTYMWAIFEVNVGKYFTHHHQNSFSIVMIRQSLPKGSLWMQASYFDWSRHALRIMEEFQHGFALHTGPEVSEEITLGGPKNEGLTYVYTT